MVLFSSLLSPEKGNRGVTSRNHILSCLLPAVKHCVTLGSTAVLGNEHLMSQQLSAHLCAENYAALQPFIMKPHNNDIRNSAS